MSAPSWVFDRTANERAGMWPRRRSLEVKYPKVADLLRTTAVARLSGTVWVSEEGDRHGYCYRCS
ncbi:hypothetical protein NOCARDAX2BIS_720006 [Nocardioides sp. AX2bis]|nr:hypothetical protein NOCARDAX2BIS_720006 [Nocardioides sp. AX2bis]